MSPFPTNEVSPELSSSPSQGNTAPPLSHVIKSYVRSRNLSQESLGDKSRDHTDVQSLNLIASSFTLFAVHCLLEFVHVYAVFWNFCKCHANHS